MTKHFDLTDETIEVYGRTLFRIQAVKDLPHLGVMAGDLGGLLNPRRTCTSTRGYPMTRRYLGTRM